ncbi:hypothetical protein [Thermomonas sp.]|uniref:hypothetical protein n=1 Tax=Thermomonas sp. TaxID=1971895 RepID=UPI001E0917FE|nr:hypothetical protein [Thermomonas sp.]MBZ0087847.1 hypothetical protein [Thermomonas sp.]HRO63787.1 hypothetical protein [Thermomonas sp.]
MRLLALSLACLLPLASLPAAAADASVEARLTARGLKYTIDDDGDYKVILNFSEEGRTQLIYVSGGTEDVSGLSIREVFAPAANIKTDGLTAEMAMDLLRESRTKKIGAWEIAGDYLYYVIKLPDSANAQELNAAIRVAGSIADDKEIELSGDSDRL